MTMLVITLPNGRSVSLGTYAKAWKTLLTADPHEQIKGWDWFPTDAGWILARMRDGLQDRINLRGGSPQRALSERRLYSKIQRAAVRGALVYRCRSCGSTLDPLTVNPNNQSSRYCVGCHH